MEQETKQQLEKNEEKHKPGIPIPPLPNWPTSVPGPRITQPPPGQGPTRTRTEQMVELEYDQETGTPKNSPLLSS
jgi:hypothetical protein